MTWRNQSVAIESPNGFDASSLVGIVLEEGTTNILIGITPALVVARMPTIPVYTSEGEVQIEPTAQAGSETRRRALYDGAPRSVRSQSIA